MSTHTTHGSFGRPSGSLWSVVRLLAFWNIVFWVASFALLTFSLGCGSVPKPAKRLGTTASGPTNGANTPTNTSATPQPSGASAPGASGTEASPSGAISVVVPAVEVALTQNTELNLALQITRSAPFTGAVSVEAVGLPAGVTSQVTPIAAGATSGALRLRASATASLGAVAIRVLASAGTLSGSATVSLRVVAAEPSAPLASAVTGMTVVRQGQGSATLHVRGENLDSIAAGQVRLVFGEAALPVTSVDSQSSALLAVTFTVPHAAPIGLYSLSLTRGLQTFVSAGAVRVSSITVRPSDNPEGGGDDDDTGSADKPFATLRRALSVAASGDHIFIEAGALHAASEVFPLVVSPGVRVQGSSTTLSNGLTMPSTELTGAATQTAFELGAQASLSSLRLTGFAVQVSVLGDGASVTGMEMIGGEGGVGIGVDLSQGFATLTACDIRSFQIGIRSTDAAASEPSLTLVSSSVYLNRTGVQLQNHAWLLARNSSISSNGFAREAFHDGILMSGSSRLSLEATTLSLNRMAGVALTEQAALVAMSQTTMRCGLFCLYLADQSAANTAYQSGANSELYVSLDEGDYAIYDARPADTGKVRMRGVAFVQPSGSWDRDDSVDGPYEAAPFLKIEHAGNTVQF